MFAKIAVSVAIGFLGAYPLATASGLFGTVRESNRDSLIVASGIILGFLTLCLIGPMLRLIRQVLETLKQVEERPKPMVALTMLGLGSLLAITAMVIQVNAGSRASTGLSMNINGFTQSPQMQVETSGSLALGILTIATFLLGASLIALGIWASLKPAGSSVNDSLVKPDSREFDEVAT
jgi:hypothetical protein